jgi:hypothetical protein
MSLNYTGMPIGSALAGPLLGSGLGLALVVGGALSILGAILVVTMIPATGPRTPRAR